MGVHAHIHDPPVATPVPGQETGNAVFFIQLRDQPFAIIGVGVKLMGNVGYFGEQGVRRRVSVHFCQGCVGRKQSAIKGTFRAET